jgi:excinuclease ABC subunit A
MGATEAKMRFLPSVWIRCSDCEGQRFNEKVLAAKVPFGDRELSIADFYALSIEEVQGLFKQEKRLPESRYKSGKRILQALLDVGLGYLSLGQTSPTLSGGEAQRVKLTKFLGRNKLQDRLIVLDEPSTGLHPQDLDGLLTVLDRLVRTGATILIVEHNTDMIRAADWIIDLGPGAGPAGGQVLYMGAPKGLMDAKDSLTGRALKEESMIRPRKSRKHATTTPSSHISIRRARANNLQGVSVDIPKGKLTVVTGVSGSGKSSLVNNVLEAEARRRFLETLSLYERQSVREGPEAPVESITGLGVTLTVGLRIQHAWSTLSQFTRRGSVGIASELSHHLGILLARMGKRKCPRYGAEMVREKEWKCPKCSVSAPIAKARHFSTSNYAANCSECTGIGSVLVPRPEKLIIHPDKPLCKGAMYSPGYWPQTYLCKDQPVIVEIGKRYGFDPMTTPWQDMSKEAQDAFLYGDGQRYTWTYESKTSGEMKPTSWIWKGFYQSWVKDWDIQGTYTDSKPCPECKGAGLQPEYLAVTIGGHDFHQLNEMPLKKLAEVLEQVPSPPPDEPFAGNSLTIATRRLRFLQQVGLGYLHLNRPMGTLSAGEAQRIKLGGLLGSELTSLTILLDEPSRGMHPSELEALKTALHSLRDEGNTVIVVEHDMLLIRAADHVIDMGPGAGASGGKIVAKGTPRELAKAKTRTGRWLRKEEGFELARSRRQPKGWMTIKGARGNNLSGEPVKIPLGAMVGVCGVSGSGKSTLMIDTLGRALARKTHSSSFAMEPIEPLEFDSVTGAPARTVIVDQRRRGIGSPSRYLGIHNQLLKIYADSDDAQALGIDRKTLGRPCKACKGRGRIRIEMGFLPDAYLECETCQGTGYLPEAWEIRVKGVALPEVNHLTLDKAYKLFRNEPKIAEPLELARSVGLGYLVWHQPAFSLSGGEVQRLKITRELMKKTKTKTLYILDEPTVGLHMEDVVQLARVLHKLVENEHTVVLVEHHPQLLAACDWIIELGPVGGPEGGKVMATGTPEEVSQKDTPTAPYLREVLEVE